jgi:acetolactate synthase-1/2/3 large subunit
MGSLEKLAEDIVERGIKHVFGIPGSGPSLTLIDHLQRHNVDFCLTHFEGTAAIMAGTLGRLSGNAGVSVSIKGPGLANMIPGMTACYFESLPVVAVTESYLPDTPHSKAHKRLDHKLLTAGVVKGSRFLSSHGPGFHEMADWSETEIPGPVHFDISGTPIESDSPIIAERDKGKEGFDTRGFFELVSSSKRPVVIAGTLAIRSGWSEWLNKLSIPVFSVAAAKGVVNETLPQSAGVYTGAGLELTPEYSIIPKADLIICLGLRHKEVLNVVPFQCKTVNVDPLGEVHSRGYKFESMIEGSKEQMDKLYTLLENKEWGLDLLREDIDRMRDHMMSHVFMPANVYMVIEEYFKNKARIILDTGNFCTIGEHIWRVHRSDLYLSSGQGRYMGTAIPMALGSLFYDSEVPVVAFKRDGSIGVYKYEVKIAVERRFPLLLILMSDGFFGSIRGRAIKSGLTQKPVTISNSSWIKVLEGLGVESVYVEGEEKLLNVLGGWNSSSGPLFIQINFDPDKYQSMVDKIRAG